MDIQIEKLDFVNFRQYGTGSLEFKPAAGADSKLFAFVAPNGTGKTTLLKMIVWCLYGEENPKKQAQRKEQHLPLVNIKVLNETECNKKIPVSVTLRFSVKGNFINFTRSITYTKKENGQLATTAAQLTAVVTPAGRENTQTLHGEQADVLVKQYFDKAIYNFYFFDGEKLSDFFDTPLKESIYNIAQVNLLENAVKHTGKLKGDFNRNLSRSVPNIEEKQQELDAKRSNSEGALREKNLEQEAIHKSEAEVNDLEKRLRGFEPVKKIQEERDRLNRERKQLEEQYEKLLLKQNEFIRKYTVLLGLYPRIKALHEYIEEESKNGKLPPAIDRNQILKLLDHPEEPCPICGTHLDASICQHLRELLKEYEISSSTANLFSSFRSPLEELLRKAQEYAAKKESLINERRTIIQKMKQNEKELEEKDRAISQYGGESGSKKIIEMNEKLRSARQELKHHNQKFWQLEGIIKGYDIEIQRLDKELTKLNKESDLKKEYKEKYQVLCKLSDAFEKVKNDIVDETKKEMQTLTWNFFMDMIWKKHTFGKIVIDDQYNVTVYNMEGRAMTSSLSETEKMALAYSFTLAVHDISGKNCPLVIDSPLGRVSDANRERMARSLLQVAKEKQIIMLFTPDEYSPAVAKLYDQAATVRTLKLSADESHVEGVECNGTGKN